MGPGNSGELIVLKFGSSVLNSAADLPAAVHEIYRWHRAGWRVMAVVSAIGAATEALLGEARALASEPEPQATAELLAIGERRSAALLGIALHRAGIVSRVIDPRQIGLTTAGAALDGEPIGLGHERAAKLLETFPVLIMAGFFGYDMQGQVQLLGRGGSDFSAVYVASALGAKRCRLLKDVDGVYERDPAAIGDRQAADEPPKRFVTLGYAEAVERAAPLVQPKAVRFLQRQGARAEVAGLAMPHETLVGDLERSFAERAAPAPTPVLILGCGTVGSGVFERLASMPEHFCVSGVLVRDRKKHAGGPVPAHLLHDSHAQIADLPAAVVVDALPALEPSGTLVRRFLARGMHVVSANKTLVAEAGIELQALAARGAASLRYSAAVGGSAPMIETLAREAARGDIHSLTGILNGTCNYVLDRYIEGMSLEDAVRAAQARGFAEADPSEDLSGRDTARKLRILARHAFGRDLDALEVEPLDAATLARCRAALRTGETLRLVAVARKIGDRIAGQVRLEALAASHPLAGVHDEWNRLIIGRDTADPIVVSGRGAGRWPTSEAVLADLFDLRRTLR